MPLVATRADALRLESSGTEIAHLAAVGAIPGVVILAVAARNGPGTGTLRSEGAGTTLSWRAPGSETFGDGETVTADGDVLLEDGEDNDKWIRVEVHHAQLAPGPAADRVFLADAYNNAIASDDVTAAEASAGDVETYTVTMANDGDFPLEYLVVWVDPAAAAAFPGLIEISDDGVVWVSPTSEGAALALSDLNAAATDTLHIRRSIDPAAASDPAAFIGLEFRYFELSQPARYHNARGLTRIFNAAEFRFYRSDSAAPEESDTPFDTNATLPYEPADLYADGTWRLSMSYFNGVLDSGFLPLGPNGETFLRLDVVGGVVVGSPPNAPSSWYIELTADNKCRVVGFYFQTGALRADGWALTYETDGSTPGEPPAVTPDHTEDITGSGFVFFDHTIPSGTLWEVRLQMRRALGGGHTYSEGSEVQELDIVLASGDPGPQRVTAWAGRMPEEV